MADRLIKSETLQDIADAIRSKTLSANSIKPSAFASEIAKIEIGEIPEGYIKPSGRVTLSIEGTFDITRYAEVVTRNMIPSTPGMKYLSGCCYGDNDSGNEEIVLAAFEGSMPITSVGPHAFENKGDIRSVIIPDGYGYIYERAFKGCDYLSYVQLPKTLIHLGESAFESCTRLESFAIPPNVPEICSYTFRGCTNLRSVIIPEGVTRIGAEAFYNCSSLHSIYLPYSIEGIGANAFAGTNISAIYTAGDTARWGSVVLGENWNGGTIKTVYYQAASGAWREISVT